jgi:hypothetical protein
LLFLFFFLRYIPSQRYLYPNFIYHPNTYGTSQIKKIKIHKKEDETIPVSGGYLNNEVTSSFFSYNFKDLSFQIKQETCEDTINNTIMEEYDFNFNNIDKTELFLHTNKLIMGGVNPLFVKCYILYVSRYIFEKFFIFIYIL